MARKYGKCTPRGVSFETAFHIRQKSDRAQLQIFLLSISIHLFSTSFSAGTSLFHEHHLLHTGELSGGDAIEV
jgi:hypothetical protein